MSDHLKCPLCGYGHPRLNPAWLCVHIAVEHLLPKADVMGPWVYYRARCACGTVFQARVKATEPDSIFAEQLRSTDVSSRRRIPPRACWKLTDALLRHMSRQSPQICLTMGGLNKEAR